MTDINHILVPTDFSENSINACTHAQELAQTYGAKVDLMHVVPTMKYFNKSINKLGIPIDMEEELYPKVLEEAVHQLENIMEDYIQDTNRGETIAIIRPKPAKAIVERAKEGGYSIIVMAAKGEHFTDLMAGGVTEKVIRHSEVPVFTVDNRIKVDEIENILIPTDTSIVSFSCIPLALTLAVTYDAEITLFHTLELYGSMSENIDRDESRSEKMSIYETILDRLEDYLISRNLENILLKRGEVTLEDQLVITDDTSSKSIRLKTVIEKGISAHYKIETYAPENADIVVMTTHGHSGLAHFLLGSTTEKVVQHLNMPVLTVKPGEKEFKDRDD